jgi:hypothetical protein
MDNYGLVKDLLLWLYVDFLSVGSVGIKKLSSLLLLSLYSGLVPYGVVLVWRGYVVGYCMIGCCLIFGFIRFCICVSGIISQRRNNIIGHFPITITIIQFRQLELSVVFVELSNNCNSPSSLLLFVAVVFCWNYYYN